MRATGASSLFKAKPRSLSQKPTGSQRHRAHRCSTQAAAQNTEPRKGDGCMLEEKQQVLAVIHT